uniref:Uncharacterized protein n=1 Tax=Anguilla anguilla TaxID=7936 RepID=A0A0E9US99_ANGAN
MDNIREFSLSTEFIYLFIYLFIYSLTNLESYGSLYVCVRASIYSHDFMG